jgi:potassium-dependent mechanosensitive channel
VTDIFSTVWRFEVARIGDKPVHVSQCAVAIVIIVVGLWLARRVSRLLVGHLSRLPGVKPAAVAAIEKLVFYVLVLAVVAVALQTVNIPISAFAVLGGAFAIGLGFGAQNLFNNFISGLILIIEQPIRVGDLIEIEGERGRVEDVGARCTRIRRGDGVDLMVPNSKLLETTVVNWTLADRRVRTSVSVGVAYGSPAREVAALLDRAVRGLEGVLATGPVEVVFADFGTDALVFEIHFWTEIESGIELRETASRVRFAIDEAFRAAGVTIAFPQRDVHLDTSKPVDVRVVPGG